MESVKLPPLKDQVAGALRQEIFARHLEDGQELAQEEIARTLGVSRIPVREAFLMLESEGLLERLPNRHVRVVGLTAERLRQNFAVLAALEGELAALALPVLQGKTLPPPQEDRAYQSKAELEEHIAVCLGGRVAEQLVLGDISTGASNDIQKASSIARAMVTKYGMSEKLGTIAYGNESDEVFIGRTMAQARSYSEDVAGLIDEEVKSIVDRAYARCEEILTRCRPQLELTAQYLLAHETMSGAEFAKVFTDPEAEEFLALPSAT